MIKIADVNHHLEQAEILLRASYFSHKGPREHSNMADKLRDMMEEIGNIQDRAAEALAIASWGFDPNGDED